VAASVDPGPAAIELRLHRLAQLFDSLDPSPFLDRDLDTDAEEFVVNWARELPAEAPLTLVLHVEEPTDEGAASVGRAVRGYFAYRADMKRRELRELLVTGRRSLVVGLLFMGACLAASDALADVGRPSLIVLRESLVVAGWVAMWRPMEIFLYDWWPLVRSRRLLQRLAAMPVRLRRRRRSRPGGAAA